MGRLVSLGAWGEYKGHRICHDIRRRDGGLEVGLEVAEYIICVVGFEATRLLSIKRIWRSSKADARRFQLERDGPSA